MTRIELDCAQMQQREAAHAYLAAALALPPYYGRNLDALFDCLTSLGPCTLALCHTDAWAAADSYGQQLLPVLLEAAAENPLLHLEIQEA